jgi:hypothetical protein
MNETIEKLKRLVAELQNEVKDYNPNDPYENGKTVGINEVVYELCKIVDGVR